MSAELRLAHRRRAQLVRRVAVATVVVPAVCVVWNLIGLPAVPGLDFGGSGASADTALIVRIASKPYARGNANPFRDRASAVAAAAHRPRTQTSAKAYAPPTRAPTPVNGTTFVPADTLQSASPTDSRTPSGNAATTPAPTTPSVVPLEQPVPPVALPALPPTLPPAQVPSAPVPSALPPLSPTDTLPLLTPVSRIAGP
jgi:hypothetical protein